MSSMLPTAKNQPLAVGQRPVGQRVGNISKTNQILVAKFHDQKSIDFAQMVFLLASDANEPNHAIYARLCFISMVCTNFNIELDNPISISP